MIFAFVAIAFTACGQTPKEKSVAEPSPPAATSSTNKYDTVCNAELLNPDGTIIHQLYFYTRQPLEPFLSALRSRWGEPDSTESEVRWTNLSVPEWTHAPVRLTLEISSMIADEDTWTSVTISAFTGTGAELLIPGMESKATIKNYFQRLIEKTLAR